MHKCQVVICMQMAERENRRERERQAMELQTVSSDRELPQPRGKKDCLNARMFACVLDNLLKTCRVASLGDSTHLYLSLVFTYRLQ